MDYLLPKPLNLVGYPLHRMVAELTAGEKAQFADRGDHVHLRTRKELGLVTIPVKPFTTGSLLGFELTACVGTKKKGRHTYFPRSDWKARHAWLARKGAQLGFEIVAAHCLADTLKISAGAREFSVDKTTFTGVLKVLDADLFKSALEEGVGNTGRAFGLGLLII